MFGTAMRSTLSERRLVESVAGGERDEVHGTTSIK